MIVQFASDLHLEFPENKKFLEKHPVLPEGDILMLAGDIVPFVVMHFQDGFFSYFSDHFRQTFWIPGNHEYYHSDLAEKYGILNEKIRDNVFLVNNVSVKLENIRFIFSTMWTRINPASQWWVERGMNDFHVIRYKSLSLRFI